jgi:hypothetical protein
VAVGRRPVPDNAFRYMIGVANNMLADQQKEARQLIAEGAI